MIDASLLLLGGDDVAELLAGQEAAIMETIARAYAVHGRGSSVVPHSSFLRLPGGQDRIIALPAYLGERFGIVGMKWIASFPGNLAAGLARASGLVVLSSVVTGWPRAVVEGSLVSAKRTAASAALAARALHVGVPGGIGLLGCGVIGFETLRFLLHVWPAVEDVVVCDLSADRAARFVARSEATFPGVRMRAVPDPALLLGGAPLVAIATTAMQPHIERWGGARPETVLHLSLRDLGPSIILAADNVVDDAAHVCRAETSLHLAERLVGDRRFIRAELAAVLAGTSPVRRAYDGPTIFSPFGLGILDIALADFVCRRATARGQGARLPFASTAAV